MLHSLMSDDHPLTLAMLFERAATQFPDNELVSRFPDGRIHRYRYADFARRTRKLANALATLGIEPGDRVATLCWNEHRHLELYFAVPLSGAVVHTLNARLHADELTYIVNDAADRALFVHSSLLEAFEEIRDRVSVEHVIVIPDDGETPEGYRDYEELIADEPEVFEPPPLDERQASGMCHTSGTTGRPKGVLYSHRSTSLLAMMSCMTDTVGVRERDSILPVVPMYHANAWGLPYAATYAGAKQVFPGRDLSAASLLRLFADEGVTLTGGVPTVFLDVLRMLDERPGEWDLSSMRSMLIGGSAAPPSLIEGFDRHGLHVTHAWGMTEMNPLGSIANLKRAHDGLDADDTLAARARQGHAQPLIQFRHVSEDGTVQPWDGEALGELQVRGPTIARAYYGVERAEDFVGDGWFRTGDIVTIDEHGSILIADRARDVVKSGGEWISSVALENALMAHPAVVEAAVFAAEDERWGERPLAAVVRAPDASASDEELRAWLEPQFLRWWLPAGFVAVDEVPKTSTGKFDKAALRERYGRRLIEGAE